MSQLHIHTSELKEAIPQLRAGDRLLLSGTVYTSRDAAHKRIFSLLDEGKPLPYPLEGSVIYYAGPTPAQKGMAVGSCGPTTSSRMDPYAPRLLDLGLTAMIGKGERSQAVIDAIVRNQSAYFCAVGGAGALIACCPVKKLISEKKWYGPVAYVCSLTGLVICILSRASGTYNPFIYFRF